MIVYEPVELELICRSPFRRPKLTFDTSPNSIEFDLDIYESEDVHAVLRLPMNDVR